MDKIDIENRIIEIVKKEVFYEDIEIKPDVALERLGVDSLEVVCIHMEIEKEFNLVIEEELVQPDMSISDLVEIVYNKTTDRS